MTERDLWQKKVIHWFFSVVAALERTQQAGVKHPFNRAAVHVTTVLLDNHLSSLPITCSMHFHCNQIAYQVLPTSCLLLGMHLVHHQQRNKSTAQDDREETLTEMRCTIKHHKHMDQQASHAINQYLLEIPSTSAILWISAAPKCISEEQVLTTVREISFSCVFPCCQAVTALDFIQVFFAPNSLSDAVSISQGVLLEPAQERHANILADVGLIFVGFHPSIVACAAITIAKLRPFLQLSTTCVQYAILSSVPSLEKTM
ncbi:hypothetical protein ACHAW6_000275, partial [Cyclotella cf. meneghiniana]